MPGVFANVNVVDERKHTQASECRVPSAASRSEQEAGVLRQGPAQIGALLSELCCCQGLRRGHSLSDQVFAQGLFWPGAFLCAALEHPYCEGGGQRVAGRYVYT